MTPAPVPPAPQPPGPPVHVESVITPCSAQRAVQWLGVTCTTIRRRHRGQYRGGSSSSRWAQTWCLPQVRGRPQYPQYMVTVPVTAPR